MHVCSIPYLIIALCASVLQVTSWQKAVNAVSGDEILEDVISDLTLAFRAGSTPSSDDEASGASEDAIAGKQVSALMGALG